jgi:hypothetical protein
MKQQFELFVNPLLLILSRFVKENSILFFSFIFRLWLRSFEGWDSAALMTPAAKVSSGRFFLLVAVRIFRSKSHEKLGSGSKYFFTGFDSGASGSALGCSDSGPFFSSSGFCSCFFLYSYLFLNRCSSSLILRCWWPLDSSLGFSAF